MAQSQLELYNMALSIVGADYTIAAVDEEGVPAHVCELWYPNVRQTFLQAAHWNCAKRYARLVEQTARDDSSSWATTDPEPGYAYSYTLPANLLAARYLTTFEQFALGYDSGDAKKIISCNVGGTALADAPILCFTIDVTDFSLFEPDLYQGMAFALAGAICQPLTGKNAKADRTYALANDIIREARTRNANENYRLMQQMPVGLQERGYTYTADNPYVYPYGSMFVSTGAPVI